MEDNKDVVETETTEVEETKETVEKVEKTFTQNEFDDALAKAIKRKTKDLPSDEELKSYREWKNQQQSDTDKLVEKEKENQKLVDEKNALYYENLALKKGVKEEDLDYIIYKVLKQEGDFEDNLNSYLQDNPKFTTKEEAKATGVQNKGTSAKEETGVNAILKAKHPELF